MKGDIDLECQYKGNKYHGTFHIADTPAASQPILGLCACLQLNVLQLILSINSNKTMTKDTVLEDYKHLLQDWENSKERFAYI